MPEAFDLDAYLIDAYQGEVLGETLFALLAEREDDASRVGAWRRLERLERHVKGLLRSELEARRLPTAEEDGRRRSGGEFAIALSRLPWTERAHALGEAVQGFVQRFRDAAAQAPASAKRTAELVLHHEEALLAFFERGSLDAVEAFLRQTGAEEEPPIPEGVKLTPIDPDFQNDPANVFHLLRRRAPVHRDRAFGGVVLTRHDDVRRVIYDLDFHVDPRKALPDDPVRRFTRDDEGEPSMLFLDDPEHKRLRNLVSRDFTPRVIQRLRPVVQQVARELVDAIEAHADPEFDLIESLAAPLPAIAIARVLGVDPAQQASFKAWSEAANVAFFNPFCSEDERRAGEEAQLALDACFRDEIAARRASPRDDLIDKLVHNENEGDRLSDDEIVTMCDLLLIAGNVTTTDLIGNGVRALLEHPDQLAKLRANPEKIANAVEEMLRFDPPVTTTGRVAPYDVEIDGVPVPKGVSITCFLAAANRDPDVYPDPDSFDVEREDTHHHAFGGGAHLCLGAHLARAEAQEAIGTLIARFPVLRASPRGFRLKQVPSFRGLSEYWVSRAP